MTNGTRRCQSGAVARQKIKATRLVAGQNQPPIRQN